MKRTLTLLIACMVLLAPAVFAQDEDFPPGPPNEQHWKRLQAMRAWTIINALDLDTTTEKGAALLDALNRYANAEKDFFELYNKLVRDLYIEMESEKPDNAKITAKILEIEKIKDERHQAKISETEELARLLTPLERAKLLMAEETFRRNLRDAMRGKMPRGRGPGGPNFQ